MKTAAEIIIEIQELSLEERQKVAEYLQAEEEFQYENYSEEDIAKLEVTGQAGGNMVSVVMNGKHEVRRVSIDDSLLGEDRDMLEDMIAAAVNDAVHKVAQMSQEKLSGMTAGMGLPPGFKLPF